MNNKWATFDQLGRRSNLWVTLVKLQPLVLNTFTTMDNKIIKDGLFSFQTDSILSLFPVIYNSPNRPTLKTPRDKYPLWAPVTLVWNEIQHFNLFVRSLHGFPWRGRGIPLCEVHHELSCILVPNEVAVKGFPPPFTLTDGIRLLVPFSFIIFIYCFKLTPYETVIVIRGCNKLDLQWSPVGEER